jgi:hypothetical protein
MSRRLTVHRRPYLGVGNAGRLVGLMGLVGMGSLVGMMALAAPAQAQDAKPTEEPEDLIQPADQPAASGETGQIDPLTGLPASLSEGAAPAERAERAEGAEGAEGESEASAGEWTDQGIGISAGVAIGGRLTPGGLRVTGAYLYRLSQDDWFDGAAAFTIGSGAAECFRDRDDVRVCDHGPVDGFAVDFVGAVRRSFPSQKSFAPFVRIGAALRFVRFSGDQVAGLAVPLIGGGGVAIDLSPTMRLVAAGQLEIGGGLFSRGLGTAPQLGLAVNAGIEFALR